MIRELNPFGVEVRALVNGRPPSIRILLELLDKHALVLIRNTSEMSQEAFLSYCQEANPSEDPTLHWSTGPIMDLREDLNSKNYLFSNEKVPYHWDGAFYQVPTVLVFNCIEAPEAGAGGETVFCHTEKIVSSIAEKWKGVTFTYKTEKVAHYGGEVTVPLIQRHPKTGKTVLRFAEEVNTSLNPVSVTANGLEKEQELELVQHLKSECYHPGNVFVHAWQKGDLLLADNHSLLHGRNAFKTNSSRHIRRVQLK